MDGPAAAIDAARPPSLGPSRSQRPATPPTPRRLADVTSRLDQQHRDGDAGTPPGEDPSPVSADLLGQRIPATQTPALERDQEFGHAPAIDTLGQVITYSITATNSGNVTLERGQRERHQRRPWAAVHPHTCPVESLAPGASVTCSATYTIAPRPTSTPANITNTGQCHREPTGRRGPGHGHLGPARSSILGPVPRHQRSTRCSRHRRLSTPPARWSPTAIWPPTPAT